jgi:hypothetical protein
MPAFVQDLMRDVWEPEWRDKTMGLVRALKGSDGPSEEFLA